MALTTRKVTNVGDAMTYQNGVPSVNATVTFRLVDAAGNIKDMWDATSGEYVVSIETEATLDASGEFSVYLWPNDRGAETTYYKCTTSSEGTPPVMGQVLDVVGDLLWIDFMQAAIPIPEAP